MTSQVDLDIECALLEGARDRLRSLGARDLSETLLVMHSLRNGATSASLTHLLPRLDAIVNDLSRGAPGAVDRACEAVRGQLERIRISPDVGEDELDQCFIEEAGEYLATARDLLNSLEVDGRDAVAAEELYRVVHTFKGAAGMVGRRETASAAHLLEELVQELKDGERILGTPLVRRLRQAFDLLERCVERPDQAKELEITLLALLSGAEPFQSTRPLVGYPRTPRRRRAKDRSKESKVVVRLDGVVLHEMRDASRSSRSIAVGLRRQVAEMRIELDGLTPIADELIDLAERAASTFERHHLFEMARSVLDVVDTVDRRSTGLERNVSRLERRATRLEGLIDRSQQVRASWIFERLEAVAEEAGVRTGRPLQILRVGEDVVLERRLASWVVEPLLHLVRNAVAHGLEAPAQRTALNKEPAGRIALEAQAGPGWLSFSVYDDGRGIDVDAIRHRVAAMGLRDASTVDEATDDEILEWIFLPGVTSRQEADEVAGRGVGLDAVRRSVARRGGELDVETWAGRGTRFQIRLPGAGESVSLVIFEVGGVLLALPSDDVFRVDSIGRGEVPLGESALADVLDLKLSLGQESCTLQTSLGPLLVDRVRGRAVREVRSIRGRLAAIGPYAGVATTRSGEDVALVLDVEALASASRTEPSAARVLVVEDSPTVRGALGRALRGAGFLVTEAIDGVDGWERLREVAVDAVVTDLEMPRMGGFELIDRIRGGADQAELPVIVVTSKSTPELRRRADSMAVDAFFHKEWGDRAFVRTVTTIIERKRRKPSEPSTR